MYGVSYGVDPELRITDLTHDIPQYDIWEASYRLIQTVNYWPEGSVFQRCRSGSGIDETKHCGEDHHGTVHSDT